MDASAVVSLHEQLMTAFGRDALETIAAVVAWSHVRSLTIGQAQFGEVGERRCGVLRWLVIDDALTRLEGRFPNVRIAWVDSGNGHIEMSASRFKLVVAHDRSPDALVPASLYAKALAQNNFPLFQHLLPDSGLPEPDAFCAVLFHSKADERGSIPATLDIRFPDGDSSYLEQHMRLFEAFPNLKDESWLLAKSAEWSDHADGAAPIEYVNPVSVLKLKPAAQEGT